MTRRIARALPLLTLSVLVACGGGSSSGGAIPDGGGSGTGLIASFLADEPTPGANTVTLQEGSKSGNSVTVLVAVTDVADVWAASMDILFNPTQAEFVGYSAGDLLESGGASVLYQASVVGSDRLVVGASRTGGAGGTNASGTRTLIRLTFRLRVDGSTAAAIENNELRDGQATPQPIAGLSWAAGRFAAN